MQCEVCEKPIYGRDDTGAAVVCGSCALTPLETPQKKPKNAVKSSESIRMNIMQMAGQSTPANKEVPMKMVKVKSNSARDKVLYIRGLCLAFNNEGIAEIPAHQEAVIRDEMRVRPGRFSIVGDTPAPVAAKKNKPSKEELVAEALRRVELANKAVKEAEAPVEIPIEIEVEAEVAAPEPAEEPEKKSKVFKRKRKTPAKSSADKKAKE